MAAEEIAHKVLKEDGDIQIRLYEPSVVAEITIEGTQKEAPNKAFRTLFDFINGNNVAQKEIEMTTPVSQEPVSQKIPMTTPVSQQRSEPGKWTIAFHMPSDMNLDETPKPKDERVSIREIPFQKKAAIRFSGTRSDNNIEKHESELRTYLKENDIPYKEPPKYAFYNSPFMPWFLRRNEVMFTLEE